MRVVAITNAGGPEVLQVQERPDPPAPDAGEVQVAVRAAGVNFSDLLARAWLSPQLAKLAKVSDVVGYEISGIIEAVGAGVSPDRIGERVTGATLSGGYTDRINLKAEDTLEIPAEMSFEQGAAIPVNYGTAWAALHGVGSLRFGERVLVHSAAGGVGVASVQLARAAGATIHGTSSPSKHARLEEIGVDHTIDYRRKRWWKGLEHYDLILDALGGSSLRRSYKLLNQGGRLIAYGFSSVQQGEKRSLRTAVPQGMQMLRGFNTADMLGKSKGVIGLNMNGLWQDRGTLQPWLTPLTDLLDRGIVAPIVHAAVPFADAPEAHRILIDRENFGKVVLVP